MGAILARDTPANSLYQISSASPYIYSRLAGYEDTNDAERLAEDPTFRMLASRERQETSVALTSTLHWFETDVLTEERNHQVDIVELELPLAAAGTPARPDLDDPSDDDERGSLDELREVLGDS